MVVRIDLDIDDESDDVKKLSEFSQFLGITNIQEYI